jgi:uncharacterized protein GlcG (DUF336 family)
VRIPFPLSRILGSVAESAAAEMGFAVAIAIVDHEGLLEYFARMDGTLPVSTELAVSKAYTAAALRMTTREVGQLALPGNPLYGIQHSHGGKIILFGGGFPLKLRGQVSGGIGISGGTVEEDEQVARVVLDRLGEMERLADWIKPLLPGKLSGNNRTLHLERRIGTAFLKEDGILPLEFSPVLSGAFIIAFHDNP